MINILTKYSVYFFHFGKILHSKKTLSLPLHTTYHNHLYFTQYNLIQIYLHYSIVWNKQTINLETNIYKMNLPIVLTYMTINCNTMRKKIISL
jgi:hypothetical protein